MDFSCDCKIARRGLKIFNHECKLQEALKEREDSVRNYESKMNSSEIQAEKNKRELKKLEYLLGETEVGSKDR